MKRIILPALVVFGSLAPARGEDFSQWRGQHRNGLTTGGPALDIRWGKGGPIRLWESEKIPGLLRDGFGCVSVVSGKAYVYAQWWRGAEIATRTLGAKGLRRLGRTAKGIPKNVVAEVEAARMAPELAKLSGRARSAWIKEWTKEHGLTAPDKKALYNFAVDRLNRGTKALPLDLLAKVQTIRDKRFPDQAALDTWLAENDVSGGHKAAVLAVVPTAVRTSWDALICLDAADGKTVWKSLFDGAGVRGYPYGASSTPTVVDGRCYFCGSRNDVYCVNAETGEKVWQVKVAREPTGWTRNHSSPLVFDGKVIVTAGPLVALEVATGNVLWRQPKVMTREPSPVRWRSGDRTLLLCNRSGRNGTVYCVNAADGAVLWSAPGGGSNTPAIVGDALVTSVIVGKFVGDHTKYGLVAYRLSSERAEKLWSKQKYSAGGESALIHGGYVYNFGPRVAVCIELATGRIAWEQRTTHAGWRSPVLADDKIITSDGSSIIVIRATPGKYELLGRAKLPIGQYTSPVIADGRLYLRQRANVACYDLTRPGANAP